MSIDYENNQKKGKTKYIKNDIMAVKNVVELYHYTIL